MYGRAVLHVWSITTFKFAFRDWTCRPNTPPIHQCTDAPMQCSVMPAELNRVAAVMGAKTDIYRNPDAALIVALNNSPDTNEAESLTTRSCQLLATR